MQIIEADATTGQAVVYIEEWSRPSEHMELLLIGEGVQYLLILLGIYMERKINEKNLYSEARARRGQEGRKRK